MKLKNPLMSISASGSIGKHITYSNRKNENQVRWQKKQVDYVNPTRSYARGNFKIASDWWALLTPTQKLMFDEYTKEDL